MTPAIRRALLRWQIRRDDARLARLHANRAAELAALAAQFDREIAIVEGAISDASARLAELSRQAIAAKAFARSGASS